jgi:hypothetical protein
MVPEVMMFGSPRRRSGEGDLAHVFDGQDPERPGYLESGSGFRPVAGGSLFSRKNLKKGLKGEPIGVGGLGPAAKL